MCLGIPGKIIEIFEESGLKMGKVDFGGVTKVVCLEYIPDAQVEDYIVVHVGFGISKLNKQEALQMLSYLEQIGFIDGESER